jgi:hypothetical protein
LRSGKRGEGVEGYVHIPNATANRLTEGDPVTPCVTWGASVLIVPGPDETIARVVARLKEYAGACKDEPCLKLLIADLEEMF